MLEVSFSLVVQRHNAMINVLAGMGPDVDLVADMFEDESFSRDAMQDQWKRIERAMYNPGNVADHGFDGWLQINDNPSIAELNASNPAFLGAHASRPSTCCH